MSKTTNLIRDKRKKSTLSLNSRTVPGIFGYFVPHGGVPAGCLELNDKGTPRKPHGLQFTITGPLLIAQGRKLAQIGPAWKGQPLST